jgi:thiamine pyrophosphokinase
MDRILIFANGDLPNLELARSLIHPDDFIIAADGGTRHVLALGLTPHVVIGDLDSLNMDAEFLNEKGVHVLQFSRDKNETDLELAINHALTLNPTRVIILAALGGRLDQTLANFSLLTDHRLSDLDIRVDDGVDEAFFCRDQARVSGRSDDLVSLIPWGGEVSGVITGNLKWPLFAETLYPHKTRGISNEMLGEIATIKINSGLLLIIHRRVDH